MQQATKFHLQANQQDALADVDMERLKFLYSNSDPENKDSLYLKALVTIAASFSDKPVSSEALVLQGQYYQGLDSLKTAYNFYKKAVASFPESMGGKNAAGLIKELEGKELSATVESENIPNKPLLTLLNYKNLSSAKIAVYRLSESQLKVYLNGHSANYNYNEQAKYRLDYLKNFRPVQTNQFTWSDLGDYRKHSLEISIAALPPRQLRTDG